MFDAVIVHFFLHAFNSGNLRLIVSWSAEEEIQEFDPPNYLFHFRRLSHRRVSDRLQPRFRLAYDYNRAIRSNPARPSNGDDLKQRVRQDPLLCLVWRLHGQNSDRTLDQMPPLGFNLFF